MSIFPFFILLLCVSAHASGARVLTGEKAKHINVSAVRGSNREGVVVKGADENGAMLTAQDPKGQHSSSSSTAAAPGSSPADSDKNEVHQEAAVIDYDPPGRSTPIHNRKK